MIQDIQILFSNRELASFFWFIIALVFMLFKKSIRKSIGQVLIALFNKKIISIISAAFIYSGSIILLLYLARIWNTTMVKTSIYWFFMTALVILFNIQKTNENTDYFKNIILDNFKFMLLLEFIVNIHNFSFLFEIIFISIIVFLSLLLALAGTNHKYIIVEKSISIIFSLVGLILLIFSIIDIAKSIQDYTNFEALKTFLLPIVLSIAFVPFACLIAIFMDYEVLFKRYSIFLEDKKLLRYARRRTLVKFGLKLQQIKSLSPIIMREFYTGMTKEEIKSIIK